MSLHKITAFTFALLFATSAFAQSAVRGMLVTGEKNAPVSGISVTLLLDSKNNVRSAPAITGLDGMFYIYDIAAGSYKLEVWDKGFKSTPLLFDIKVKPESANQFVDVPLINLSKQKK